MCYIRITTRCNMTCEHCCYSCGAQGDDMSLETYRQTLEFCEDQGSTPFLGGGEPTIHPKFEQFLCEALTVDCDGQVGIITNGKLTRRALMIASMVKGGVIYGQLSRDVYHDEIEEEVVIAFEATGQKGYRGINSAIRDTSSQGTRDPLPHGRGKDSFDPPEEEEEDTRNESDCPCDDWVVHPNGNIHQCGCEDSPQIGDVWSGVCVHMSTTCCRSQEFRDECIENEAEHLLV